MSIAGSSGGDRRSESQTHGSVVAVRVEEEEDFSTPVFFLGRDAGVVVCRVRSDHAYSVEAEAPNSRLATASNNGLRSIQEGPLRWLSSR
jgi:hypothetical protein